MNWRKNIASLIFFIAFGLKILGQEQSVFKQYYLSPFVINPAFTGAELYPGALLSAKKQWIGIPDAPSTYLLSGNYRIGTYDFYDPKGFVNKGPLKLKNRIGIGGAIFQDNYGPSRQTGGNVSYGYHAPVGNDSELSFGLSVTATHYSFRTEMLNPDDPNDPYLLNSNDPVFRMNFNIGVLYHNKKSFAGISAAKLFRDVQEVNDKPEIQPTIFLIAGHKFVVNKTLFIEPALVILKTPECQVEFDFMGKLYIKHLNWIAFSYGTSGKTNFMACIHLVQMLNFGYSYEFTLSKIAQYNYGTHNLFIGINLGLFGIDEIRQTILRKI